jgi:hypothetical protein
MLNRCYAITLNSNNWRKTRDYYVDALLMHVMDERPGSSITLDGGAVQITIESLYNKPDSLATLYFETEDVRHFCDRLRRHGHNVPNESSEKAELIDPDGRKIVVTQRF